MNIVLGFPGGSVVKNLLANTGDSALIPGWGRSPGEENGNPLQCSCLENPMDRGIKSFRFMILISADNKAKDYIYPAHTAVYDCPEDRMVD